VCRLNKASAAVEAAGAILLNPPAAGISPELLTAADMANRFFRAKADCMEELLQSLTILGSARQVADGKHVSP
jgi:hypothetical protein